MSKDNCGGFLLALAKDAITLRLGGAIFGHLNMHAAPLTSRSRKGRSVNI